MAISGRQRFTAHHPCPVCAGHGGMAQHQGRRCYGFISDDQRWAHCTREEHAGPLSLNPGSGAYPHRLEGPCKCGIQHGEIIPGEISYPDPKPRKREFKPDKLVASYQYCDDDGALIAVKHRYERMEEGEKIKRFTWQRPDGQWGLGDAKPLLYKTELLSTSPSIFVVEGEKCVEAVLSEDFVAVCSPHGAPDPRVSAKGNLGGKWLPEFTEQLAGKRVVLVPDRDMAGQQFFQLVARELRSVTPIVRILNLRVLGRHGDIADYIGTARFLDRDPKLGWLARHAIPV